jgi:four helix bundle protein
MARPKDYHELIVWQKAMALGRNAYALSAQLPRKESYGLLSQIRRAAISVPSNIAEGHGRLSDLQFRHFLGNARGSIYELQTQFEFAADLGYLDRAATGSLLQQSSEVTRLLNALIAALSPTRSQHEASSRPACTANSASTASSAKRVHP